MSFEDLWNSLPGPKRDITPKPRMIRNRKYQVDFVKVKIVGKTVSKGRTVASFTNQTRKAAEELKAEALRTSDAHRVRIIETKTIGWNGVEVKPKDFGSTIPEGHVAGNPPMTKNIQKRNEIRQHNKIENARRQTKCKEVRYSLSVKDERHPYHQMYLEQVRKNGFKIWYQGTVIFEGLRNEGIKFLEEEFRGNFDEIKVIKNSGKG